jgi:hypothetical protein
MKTGPDAIVPPKTSMEEKNMKMGPDALGTVKNEIESAKHENWTRRLRFRPRRVRWRQT